MPDKEHKIVAFGEVLWDLLPDKAILGGAPFNFINRIKERGNIGNMISRLGNDKYGREAEEKMRSLGIETDLIQTDDTHPTGTVEVFFDEDKNPDYHIIPNVAYDFIQLNDALVSVVKEADCICFGSLVQRNEVSRNTLSKLLDDFEGTYVFYDINLRKNCYTESIIKQSLRRSNILKLNNDELDLLRNMLALDGHEITESIEVLISEYDLKFCLVTYGAGGVFGVSDTGEKVYVPSYKVDFIDPLGSGDAFSAGFLHSLLNGSEMKEACVYGNVLGGIVASQQGATQPISDSEIEKFRTNSKANSIRDEFKRYYFT